jgi:DNA processing protein
MSLGVLVIEADENSGAVITARMANEQNREVFAVPGSILSPMSRGTNALIQEGAKLVRHCQDILVEFNMEDSARQLAMAETEPLSEVESNLLRQISTEPTYIDQICRNCNLPIADVSSNLAIMELKGLVKQISHMQYVLTRQTR